ncbi:MAG: serine protease [Verrucomicrobiaceae bacterium]|nr:MAG: serine protease [Verrucomicrobiaceae bacterium]
MPRIPDEHLDVSVYIYPSVPDAEQGKRIGGCGFLMSVKSALLPGYIIYAVTNRHVVEDGGWCVRVNTADGGKDVFELDDRNWIFHPDGDDVAICQMPTMPAARFKYRTLGEENLLTKELMHELNIGPGDDVFVVGRFINHEGRQRNRPVMRFGNIAQNPAEPIRQSSGFEQESFLIEARSISGYSGSPVVMGLSPEFKRPDRPALIMRRTGYRILVGVSWGHLVDEDGENTGMMPVVPAWKLRELLHCPRVVQQRTAYEEEVIRLYPDAVRQAREDEARSKAASKAD